LNLLFISHDATLTGAPTLLLNLIRLIKADKSYSVKIILKNGSGSLINDFKNEAELLVWKKPGTQNILQRIRRRLNASLQYKNRNQKKIQRWIDESDFVVSNTITNGDFLQAFNFSKVKLVLSYIHELEIATQFFTNKQDVKAVTSVSDHFFVPSRAVALHLMNNLNIPEERVSHLNYYIPLAESAGSSPVNNARTFIVGLIGTLDWRKGADILTVIVKSFFTKYPDADLLFVWKGADKNGIEYERIISELRKLHLFDKVRFDPPSPEVNDFYQSINVLLLISKEDPYPLVVLEAANNFKACICFKDAGGAPEFVKEDAGEVVPYLNIEDLTNRIFTYYNDRNTGIEKGKVAYSRYLALHFNKELILSQFEDGLRKTSI